MLCPFVTGNFCFNGIVPGLTGREIDGGMDVWINKKKTLTLAKIVDRHPFLVLYYLWISHLALPFT